jgi:polyisoprenoid-binding protein YceI
VKTKHSSIAIAGLTAALTLGLLFSTGGTALRASSSALTSAAHNAIPLTGTWNIDPYHTNVNFAVKHFGISTVRGRFDDVAGVIVADSANPANSSVEVTIATASIDTDVKMRDDHLRSPDFFDAAKYPTITFKSTKVEKRRGNNWTARGILTIHGVSKEIILPFKVTGPVKDAQVGARFGAEARLKLNRQDYGIKYNQILDNGVLAVANQVDIDISLEAVPPKPAAK